MSSTSTGAPSRSRQVFGWTCVVLLNAVVGVVSVVPIAIFLWVLGNTVGDWLGLVERDTKFGGDGELTEVTIALVLVLLCAGLFFVVNLLVARLMPRSARRLLWLVAVLVVLAPTVVVSIAPDVWRAIT